MLKGEYKHEVIAYNLNTDSWIVPFSRHDVDAFLSRTGVWVASAELEELEFYLVALWTIGTFSVRFPGYRSDL